MNVTVIYGSTKKTNTYDCVQILLNYLKENIKLKVNEFFLANDYSYNDCSPYPQKHINTGPKANFIASIAKSLDRSDLIILASPVFMCDVTFEMKIFLNNLSHYCMANNPNLFMNNKIGLVVSTTAGAGLFHTTRILTRNLNFLGINTIFKFSKTFYESNLDNINSKTRKQLIKKILKLSYKILDLYYNPQVSKASLLKKIIYSKTKLLIKNSKCNVIDLNCWKNEIYYRNSRNI